MENRKSNRLALFSSFLIGLVSFSFYTFASDGDLDKDQKPVSSPFSDSSPSNAEKEIAEKLRQKGYLVHVTPLNPFDHDLVLATGGAIPIYMQILLLNF